MIFILDRVNADLGRLIRTQWHIVCVATLSREKNTVQILRLPPFPLCTVTGREFSIHFIIHKLPPTQPCHYDSSHLHYILLCAVSHWCLHTPGWCHRVYVYNKDLKHSLKGNTIKEKNNGHSCYQRLVPTNPTGFPTSTTAELQGQLSTQQLWVWFRIVPPWHYLFFFFFYSNALLSNLLN